MILHGRDAPLIEWQGVVAIRFDLPLSDRSHPSLLAGVN
jgi:hypothetical protein